MKTLQTRIIEAKANMSALGKALTELERKRKPTSLAWTAYRLAEREVKRLEEEAARVQK